MMRPTRRQVLAGSAAGLTSIAAPRAAAQHVAAKTFELVPARADAALTEAETKTAVWAFNGRIPGPEIRVRQGDRLRITVDNKLDVATTVHWHGIRLPHAMDGVPHLTQNPIEPGARFLYEFDVPDAGTYWYHPHMGPEQVDRGLAGPLIVEERDPIRVDRDIIWMLDDWRLTADGSIDTNFANRHDLSHAGRIGMTVTINGRKPEPLLVRAGERIRLRLINSANARVFGLDFKDLAPVIVARDGQAVTPHAPDDGRIVFGPAMRIDLILDMSGAPDSRTFVEDRFYPRNTYKLIDIAYAAERLRDAAPDWPMAIAPNPLPLLDLANAQRHDITFAGGAMAPMIEQQMGGAQLDMETLRDMFRKGIFWLVNGQAIGGADHGSHGHGHMTPLLTLARGKTHVITLTNRTAWFHPIHLHGHTFRVLARNGRPEPHLPWQDTVLLNPRDSVVIGFVADNPGDWMFHCHVLEHQSAGMMGTFRVA